MYDSLPVKARLHDSVWPPWCDSMKLQIYTSDYNTTQLATKVKIMFIQGHFKHIGIEQTLIHYWYFHREDSEKFERHPVSHIFHKRLVHLHKCLYFTQQCGLYVSTLICDQIHNGKKGKVPVYSLHSCKHVLLTAYISVEPHRLTQLPDSFRWQEFTCFIAYIYNWLSPSGPISSFTSLVWTLSGDMKTNFTMVFPTESPTIHPFTWN